MAPLLVRSVGAEGTKTQEAPFPDADLPPTP